MKISHSIEIKSSREAVFRWLERPEKAMLWMTSVKSTEIIHETKDMVGTIFRETVAEDGNPIEMQGIVTSWKPNESISFHISSNVNVVDAEYSIEETQGGVCLTQNAKIQWKFPANIFIYIAGDKLRRQIVAQAEKEFGRLKQLVESDISPVQDR